MLCLPSPSPGREELRLIFNIGSITFQDEVVLVRIDFSEELVFLLGWESIVMHGIKSKILLIKLSLVEIGLFIYILATIKVKISSKCHVGMVFVVLTPPFKLFGMETKVYWKA